MSGTRKIGLAAGGLAALAALAAAGPRAQSPGTPASFADGSGGAATVKYRVSESSSASASASSRTSAGASSSATANSGARHMECSSEAEASVTQDGVRKSVRQVRKATGDGSGCTARSSAKARIGTGGTGSD
jgi:hypothetical protein